MLAERRVQTDLLAPRQATSGPRRVRLLFEFPAESVSCLHRPARIASLFDFTMQGFGHEDISSIRIETDHFEALEEHTICMPTTGRGSA